MAELFHGGHIADLAIALLLLEGMALFWYRRRTRRGLPLLDIVAINLSGIGLLIGLRLALVDAWWGWIALALLLALASHLFDLVRRWPTAPPTESSAD